MTPTVPWRPSRPGLEQDLGTLAPGKLADLLVLTRNPLDDIACLVQPGTIERIGKSSEPLASY
jgi:imidazolonepropionase-like amidohydrolase